jgi:molybdopterin molybdotransferase
MILSGGVSKGKLDFIPSVLEELGVKKRFHEVSQRPGRPLWFGMREDGKVSFALPGNPVSTYVCFYRYIRPWMYAQLGIPGKASTAILAKDFSFTLPLTYFLQVHIERNRGTILATPVPGGGSGDFVNLKNVDGFLELPSGKIDFKAGEAYPYFSFRT